MSVGLVEISTYNCIGEILFAPISPSLLHYTPTTANISESTPTEKESTIKSIELNGDVILQEEMMLEIDISIIVTHFLPLFIIETSKDKYLNSIFKLPRQG